MAKTKSKTDPIQSHVRATPVFMAPTLYYDRPFGCHQHLLKLAQARCDLGHWAERYSCRLKAKDVTSARCGGPQS
jgi:hypothetical protein